MQKANPSLRRARFGAFEVDLRSGELRKHGYRIRLQEQPLQVLLALLEHPGEVVTREELRNRLWPKDTFVDFDHGLNKAISKIRGALGDSAEKPRFVETLGRRGYRFLLPVQKVQRASPREGKIMLAVLPFENLGVDPEEEYFSDGLTEEMISQLGRLNPQRLGVIARTSAMQYKGVKKGIDQIGRELQVDYILEGSVRRSVNRVRIAAQLIQASDQTHLWARTYDRELEDLFSIQSEVALSVVRSLAVELMPAKRKPKASIAPAYSVGYEDFLKGRFYWNKFTDVASRKAILHFEHAIQKDSNYGPAYSGLALSYAQLYFLNGAPSKEAYPQAKTAALKGLEIDDTLAEAYGVLGLYYLYYEWNWAAAQEHIQRALLLDPGRALIHHEHGLYLAAMGRLEEAMAAEKKALALDPLSLLYNTAVGRILYLERQYDRAAEELRKTFELDTNFHMTHGQLGLVYEQKGRFDEAIASFQRAIDLSGSDPTYLSALGHAYGQAGKRREAVDMLDRLKEASHHFFVSSYFYGLVHLGLGEMSKAFADLEKACEERHLWLVYLNVDPAFDAVRPDLRFQSLLRRVGLPH